MKKLKKILLINWLYYSRQLIDIGDINFLTGKTGAGKSTIIDALQIVLLGELNARNFNKAANEARRERWTDICEPISTEPGRVRAAARIFQATSFVSSMTIGRAILLRSGLSSTAETTAPSRNGFLSIRERFPITALSSTKCQWISPRSALTLPVNTSLTEKCTIATRTTRRMSSRGGTFTRRLSSAC